ncbi:MAG: leuS [Acidobacteria bacterium]|nr:leuS [Acidobacteriota bacterium]
MPRYDPHSIEPRWQEYWERNKTFRAVEDTSKPKLYVLDMFPYPSGEGLHVGHPEGYTATDMYTRYQRMRGFNVLHPMGYDAFGLPAEQYAIETGTHPGATTERNIANIRRQIKRLGFSYDWDRELATTDTDYVRWTQWIFLLMYETWFDPDAEWTDPDGRRRRGRGRPIDELPVPPGVRAQGEESVRRHRDLFRLAYQAEAPVNWCAALGTVLADEEVINGRSERGNHPVQRLPLRQWMLRITSYADRLVEDLDTVQWPEPIKEMQRNWVGRSEGAEVDFFAGEPGPDYAEWRAARSRRGYPDQPDALSIRIYTTRPDTLFGATYMVLAPEHPLVDRLTSPERKQEVDAYRQRVAAMSEEDRITGRGEKSGVFTGGYATNPVTDEMIPIWIADYVLISYGTGAIMAVPGHDQRDFEFANKFGLPIRAVVMPPQSWLQKMQVRQEDYAGRIGSLSEAFVDEGQGMQSENEDVSLDGLPTPEAKKAITRWLGESGLGTAAVKYKLRDWLFSRQRYWGEPIPILHELDADGKPSDLTVPVPDAELPVTLPEMEDFKPTGHPGGPLEKAVSWVHTRVDGREMRRETNTMPQWAGSCWYYLRFCDPRNETLAWDPAKERHWMPVDLYVGGAEHAVLHLLYARFWHKVLFDRGKVSTMEPFRRLINQGMILSITYRTAEGRIVPYTKIDFHEGKAIHTETGEELSGETEKMSKSRGNVIPVDVPLQQYGADTTRLYEMFMGPIEDTKPWSMQGVEGISRFLNRAWRMIVDEDADELRLNSKVVPPSGPEGEPTLEQLRTLNKTLKAVTADLEALRFNTAISRLMEFVNFFTAQKARPAVCMERFVLMLSPLAPHLAEELWLAMGHSDSLAGARWPDFEEQYTRDDMMEVPVQINGRLRARLLASSSASREELEQAALSDPKIRKHLENSAIRKVIVVPGKLVNIVAG